MNLLNPVIPQQTHDVRSLKALVLDWAGTTVDFGSLAPARTLQTLFATRQIDLLESEARKHMGLPKKDHIRGILSLDSVRGRWCEQFGSAPSEADVDCMYEEFVPLQFSCLEEHSAVIPGIPAAVERFRARGLKIGSTTGYTREMLDVVIQRAAREGYAPDCSVTPSEAGSGRPHPYMMYSCLIQLQVYPLSSVVKVGDTPADVVEGLNAGAWSVGVAGTGNAVGLSHEAYQALSQDKREALLASARAELAAAGAHFVVDSVTDLDPILDAIEDRLASRAE